MPDQFMCKGCGLLKPVNIHLKGNQDYCRNPECQRKRKRLWQKEKMADAGYRKKRLLSQKRWRAQRPADRYQAQYRQTHPQYVDKNRVQQRIRNQQRRKQAVADTAQGELIVKTDALTNIKSGTYLLTPYASQKIVKMDAYLVQLQLLRKDRPVAVVPPG